MAKKKKGIKVKKNRIQEGTEPLAKEGEIIEESESEEPTEEETELENLVENSDQRMSTTFTPTTARRSKPISASLEQNEIQEPMQTLETELTEVPGTETQEGTEPLAEGEQSAYAETSQSYTETPTEESAQQLSDYQAQGPKETTTYDTQQTINAAQRFDPSSGLASGMQQEKRQFQQWQQNQGDPFKRGAGPSETYTVNPQKIDNSPNLPFKKKKKKGP